MGTKPQPTQTQITDAAFTPTGSVDRIRADHNTMEGTQIVAPPLETHPILDMQVLAELRQYSDDEQDLVQELVTLFLSETPMQLLALQEALSESNKEEVERRSHRLKGSAGSIGACRLREICEQVEQYARNGRLPVVEKTVASMNRELNAISDELKRL